MFSFLNKLHNFHEIFYKHLQASEKAGNSNQDWLHTATLLYIGMLEITTVESRVLMRVYNMEINFFPSKIPYIEQSEKASMCFYKRWANTRDFTVFAQKWSEVDIGHLLTFKGTL